MRPHDWAPETRAKFELGQDGKLVEGWGECRLCKVEVYVTRQDGEVVGYLIGGPRSGYPVNADCSEFLTESVMLA